MKKALVAVAVVLLVLLVTAIIAPFVIDLNQYKGEILAKVRPAVNRDVDFDRIELTVLSGFGAELQGLKIPENPEFASDNFVTLDSLQVRLKLLPLLKGEVQVSKLILKSPVVHIRRNAQGVFNFQDMVRPSEAPAEAEKPREPAGEQPPSALAVFGVGELGIKDGTVVYEDEMISGREKEAQPGPKSVTVSRLDVSVEDMSLFEAVSFDAQGSLFDEPHRNFRVFGQVGPIGEAMDFTKMPLNVTIKADSLSLQKLTESLGLPVRALSGKMNAYISAAGALDQNLDASANIAADDLVLQTQGDGNTGPQKTGAISVKLDGKALYSAAGEKLDLQSTSLEINGSRLDVTGSAQNVLTKPVWKMAAKSDSLDLGALIRLFPMYAGKAPAELSFSGPAKLDIRSAGSPNDFSVEAGLDMNLMKIVYGEMFSKSEGVPFSLVSSIGMKEGIVGISTLELDLYNLALSGSGLVNLKQEVPVADIRIEAKPFSLQGWGAIVPMLAQYQPEGAIGAVTAGIAGPLNKAALSCSASAEHIALVLPPQETQGEAQKPKKAAIEGLSLNARGSTGPDGIGGTGTLNAGGGSFDNIALGRMAGDFRYAGSRLDVPQFSVAVFNGTISGSASYQTETKDWEFSPVFKAVDAGTAVDTLTSFKDVFQGTLSGDVRLRGNAAAEGLASLSAQGNVGIKNGKLNNVDLAQAIAEGFSALEGLSGALLTGQEEAVQRNRETAFDSLDARFEMARQTVHLTSFELANIRTGKSTDSLARLKGDVALETRALDLTGDVILSERHSAELIKKTPALNALADNKQRVVIPITITGNMTRPKVLLKSGEISKAIADYYAKKGIEKGVEKLKERLGIPQSDKGSEKIIEDLFNTIIKK